LKLLVKFMIVGSLALLSGCSSTHLLVSGSAETTNSDSATSSSANPAIEYAFTQADQHPEQLLINVINESKKTLDVAIYSLTYPDIVKSIQNAKKRGVTVRIITDKIQSAGKTQKQALKILKNTNIPIKINKHSGLMHLKLVVADQKEITTGSFNYSKAASTTNDEVLLVIHDPVMAIKWSEEFQSMWNDSKGFINYIN
jgi:phosphatidylserine/phosphatidylglycerophosphate/cardiolipin synthase-like enzyme